MASLVLVTSALVVAALLGVVVVLAARRQWRRTGMAVLALALVMGAYGSTLVGVSASTRARDLHVGEWKCFDEWCVSVSSAVRSGDSVIVELSVQNRGRRAQAPDTPRAWLLHDGRRDELEVSGLTAQIPGGSTRQLLPIRVVSPAAEHNSLLVTEGGLPSYLVIGDENSPFHPQPAWPLT